MIRIASLLLLSCISLLATADEVYWIATPNDILNVYDGNHFTLTSPDLPARFDGSVSVKIYGFDVPSYDTECAAAAAEHRVQSMAWASRNQLKMLLGQSDIIVVEHTGMVIIEGPDHMQSQVPQVRVMVDGIDVANLMIRLGYASLDERDWCEG